MARIEEISAAIDAVDAVIAAACARAGREPKEVRVVGVSKHQPVEVLQSYVEILRGRGTVPCLGENYVQEFAQKKPALQGPFEAHLIGPLQRNKARDAIALFDVIETLHSERLAEALASAAERTGVTQRVFVQVNVSADPEKSGVTREALFALVARVRALAPLLRFEGLMTITAAYDEPESARGDFAVMRNLRERCEQEVGHALELSMGMSGDFGIAVEEGATIVRVGTALFGERG